MTEQADRLSNALADHYRIEHHLGEGGMSTVYLAEDLKHRRKVAVKVLRPELAAVIGAERGSAQDENGSARGQEMVVLNWFEEVQRRLGNR